MGAERSSSNFSAEKLEQLCGRIEDCLGRLSYDQVWMRNSGNENAVGNLVLHLCGNVTQWIGSGVAGGRPDRARAGWRVRGARRCATGRDWPRAFAPWWTMPSR